MTSVATTLIVLCVAMWKYGIKTNNFVGTDCLSTVFAYGLITKKVRDHNLTQWKITLLAHKASCLVTMKLVKTW